MRSDSVLIAGPRQRLLLVTLAVAAVSAVIVIVPEVGDGMDRARAAAANCGAFDRHHKGAYNAAYSGIKGAKAEIDVRVSDLCGGSSTTSTSSAWSMLQDPANGTKYAQIGWVKRSSGRTQFYQVNKDGGAAEATSFFGSPSLGTIKTYKVLWESGDNKIHLSICDQGGANCSEKHVTNWNPSGAGWSGTMGFWSGETFDNETDMPGTSGSPAHFDEIFLNQGSGWFVPDSLTGCCSGFYAYHRDFQSGSTGLGHFWIWTDPINR